LGLPRGFQGWPIQWNHAKFCGLTLVAMATKFGLDAEIQSPTGLFRVFVNTTYQISCVSVILNKLNVAAALVSGKSDKTGYKFGLRQISPDFPDSGFSGAEI